SQKTHRDPAEDAASRLRAVNLRAYLAVGVPQRGRAAGRRVRLRIAARLRLYGTLRGYYDPGRLVAGLLLGGAPGSLLWTMNAVGPVATGLARRPMPLLCDERLPYRSGGLAGRIDVPG